MNTMLPDNEDLIIWPCGTNCFREELDQFAFMSDDYEVVPYGSPDYDRRVRQTYGE